jgi:hypothetical protein
VEPLRGDARSEQADCSGAAGPRREVASARIGTRPITRSARGTPVGGVPGSEHPMRSPGTPGIAEIVRCRVASRGASLATAQRQPEKGVYRCRTKR